MNALHLQLLFTEYSMNKFPRLWAEHKLEFHTFFHQDGGMNKQGYQAYDLLKKNEMSVCIPKKIKRGKKECIQQSFK